MRKQDKVVKPKGVISVGESKHRSYVEKLEDGRYRHNVKFTIDWTGIAEVIENLPDLNSNDKA